MRCLAKYIVTALALLAAGSATAAPESGAWQASEQIYGLPNLHVYLPKQAQTALGKQRALMVVLHGCNQTARGDITDGRSGWEAVAEKYGMVIAAPDAPTGNESGTRLFAGCWDWFGIAHQRGERDIGALAAMIKGLQAREDLRIDARQVYVVGMSSGAGVAQVLACAYPELVAGAGLHSAPAMGSYVMHLTTPPQIEAETIVENCRGYAGDQAGAFATQVTSILHGSVDRLAHAAHATRNREALQILYGAAETAGAITEGKQSKGMLYKDGQGHVRLAQIEVEGLGHTFSVGDGGRGGGTWGMQFHDYAHINYPAWVTRFFFDNNLRVKP